MTLRCIRCHRPLKHSFDGYGSKCRKTAVVIPAVDRDLFGYDIAAAAASAVERLRVHVEVLAVGALMDLKHEFAAARRRLGIWSSQ